MVGGDGVAEDGEDAGAGNFSDGSGLGGHAVEVRRFADVGGVWFPLVDVAGGEAEFLPVLIAVGDGCVFLRIAVGRNGGGDDGGDFLLGRPDVAEEDGLAGGILADGVVVEVVVDAASEGVGDDERRGHEVVGADLGVDATFEVAIAAEDGDSDERVVFDGFRNVVGERAGVSDTGGAAVADGIEAELVEPLGEAGFVVIVGDDAGARGEGSFDPGGTLRPFSTAFFASSPAATMTEGLEVLVQLVMAAMTIEPWSR